MVKKAAAPGGLTQRTVPVSLLEADPDNIRLDYAAEMLDQLCQAVVEDGEFLQPPRVYQTPEGKLRSLNGSTRVLSALKAHDQGALEQLTVVETNPPKNRTEKILFQLAENETRAQLGPVDRGRAFKMLRDEGLSYRDILAECERRGIIPAGRTKGWVSQLISLTELEPEVQRMVNHQEFSINHALLLRKLSPNRQLPLAQRIVAENISIAAFEAIVAAETGSSESERLESLYGALSQTVQDRAQELFGGGGSKKRSSRRDADRRNGPVLTSWMLQSALSPASPRSHELRALEAVDSMASANPQLRALAQEALAAGHSPKQAMELAVNAVQESQATSDAVRQLLFVLAKVEQSDGPLATGGPAMAEYVRMRLQSVLGLLGPEPSKRRASA
jgi:hypothetical protein